MRASHNRPILFITILTAVVLILSLPVTMLIINNKPPQISVPSNKMPHPNGWDDFIRAEKLLRVNRHMGPISSTRPISSWTLPEYQSFMKDNAPALAAVRQGLKKQYMHPAVRSFMLDFAHHAYFRELARTLAGEAKYYEVIGKPGKAADSLLDCIEFGVVTPRGGTLISGLVGIAIESISMHFLNPLLSKLSPADLERVACRLEQIERRRVSFSDIMIEESRSNAAGESQVLKHSNAISAFSFIKWPPSSAKNVKDGLAFAFVNKTAVIRQNQAYYEAVAREQRGVFTGKSRVIQPKNLLHTGTLSAVRMREPFVQSETKMSLLRIEIALRRYRADHNSIPARLIQLAPVYLKKIPNDPFGGKPLRYKVIKGGKNYILYSIGSNFKDDGGNPANDYLLDSKPRP